MGTKPWDAECSNDKYVCDDSGTEGSAKPFGSENAGTHIVDIYGPFDGYAPSVVTAMVKM